MRIAKEKVFNYHFEWSSRSLFDLFLIAKKIYFALQEKKKEEKNDRKWNHERLELFLFHYEYECKELYLHESTGVIDESTMKSTIFYRQKIAQERK